MSYYFSRSLKTSFTAAIESVTQALKEEGFGILTQIDVRATLKEKLNVEFRKYTILGACNPPLAYRALRTEDRIGLMLPCNVIVQQQDDDTVEVAAIDPVAAMQPVANPALAGIAREVRQKLEKVVAALG